MVPPREGGSFSLAGGVGEGCNFGLQPWVLDCKTQLVQWFLVCNRWLHRLQTGYVARQKWWVDTTTYTHFLRALGWVLARTLAADKW